jgi:hypothetical protein
VRQERFFAHRFQDDKHRAPRYTARMIHLAATYWYFGFTGSPAVGGLRSI